MANYPYDELNTPLDITNLERLNNNYDQIQADIQSVSSKTTQDLNNQQQQINNLVVDGDSSPEAAQARVGIDGTNYATLKDRIDTEMLEKPSGSPKGVYATLSALQSAFPSGDNFTYVVSADGKWYFWNGTTWAAGGTYQATALADLSVTESKLSNQSVTADKTNFLTTGKNKLNNATSLVDFILIPNGQVTALAGYKTSDYILLTPGTYTFSKVRWYGFYDLNKNVITNPFVNTGNNNAVVTTTIATTQYLRVSYITSNENSVQVESGSTATSYESYRINAPKLLLTQSQIEQVAVPNIAALYPVKLTKSGETFTLEGQFDSTQNIVIVTSRNGSSNGSFNFTSTTIGGVLVHSTPDDITPIRTFTTVGANHGYTTVVIVTMSGHGKVTADLGSIWTDGVTQYTLLNISGNDLTFGCPYTVINGVTSSIYVAPIAPLTHVSGATNTGTVSITTLASSPQLYPSINNISVSYLVDGKEITVDGTYYGKEVQIVEKYNVMDYKAIIDYAQGNIGVSYKNNNVEGVVTLTNVFIFTNRLKCTTSHTLNALKKVTLANCGFLQSSVFSPAGLTRKRFMPNVLPKSGFDFASGIDLDTYATSLLFGASDLQNPSIPPSHYTDWAYLSGVRKYGFTMGYIVDKTNSKNSDRLANTSTFWDMRSSKKSYPVALQGTLNAGDYRNFEGFRNYISPEEVGNVTNMNVVQDHRNSYVYITSNSVMTNSSVRVPNRIGFSAELLQGQITLANDTVDANGIVVSSTTVNSSGVIKIK